MCHLVGCLLIPSGAIKRCFKMEIQNMGNGRLSLLITSSLRSDANWQCVVIQICDYFFVGGSVYLLF
jgi:hypothetical protein